MLTRTQSFTVARSIIRELSNGHIGSVSSLRVGHEHLSAENLSMCLIGWAYDGGCYVDGTWVYVTPAGHRDGVQHYQFTWSNGGDRKFTERYAI